MTSLRASGAEKTETTVKIIGVQQVCDGVIVVIQQEKMQIPIAEDCNTNSDEALVAKKFARAMKGFGFNVDMRQQMHIEGFQTGFWMPMEDYEQLGKPSIGDMLKLNVQVEK